MTASHVPPHLVSEIDSQYNCDPQHMGVRRISQEESRIREGCRGLTSEGCAHWEWKASSGRKSECRAAGVEARTHECKEAEKKGCGTINLFTLVQLRLHTICSPECSQPHPHSWGNWESEPGLYYSLWPFRICFKILELKNGWYYLLANLISWTQVLNLCSCLESKVLSYRTRSKHNQIYI